MLEQLYSNNILKQEMQALWKIDLSGKDKRYWLIDYILYILSNGCLEEEKEKLVTGLLNIINACIAKKKAAITKKFIRSNLQQNKIINSLVASVDIKTLAYIVKEYHYFTDLELIKLCDHHNNAVLFCALAARENISPMICDYIMAKNDQEYHSVLIHNKTAQIPEELYQDLKIKYPKMCEAMHVKGKPLLLNKKNLPYNKERITIRFSNPFKLLHSFKYEIISGNTSLVEQKINNLYVKNHLNEISIVLFLTQGDIYSFIYSISKITDIPFQYLNLLITTQFRSQELKDILNISNFSKLMIESTIQLLVLIAEISVEEPFYSYDFAEKINFKFFLTNSNNEVHNNIRYLLALLEN